ncbi:MAG: hypothetical protein ACOC3G_04815 [Phycisphaeraceae bacterium]
MPRKTGQPWYVGVCDFARHALGVLLVLFCIVTLFSIVAMFEDFEFGAAATVVGIFLGMLLLLAMTHGMVVLHQDLAEERRLRRKLQKKVREQGEQLAAVTESREELD